jgi:hypothetical protein
VEQTPETRGQHIEPLGKTAAFRSGKGSDGLALPKRSEGDGEKVPTVGW